MRQHGNGQGDPHGSGGVEYNSRFSVLEKGAEDHEKEQGKNREKGKQPGRIGLGIRPCLGVT